MTEREPHRRPQSLSSRRPRVVIVGAGFGGLSVARGLAGAPVDTLVLDRANYHLFTPLLYQVATAGLGPEEIAQPIRAILRPIGNARFRMAEVSGVDLSGRQVLLGHDSVDYDVLVLAAGSTSNYFGLESAMALGLKDIPEGLALRNHILTQFERAAWEQEPAQRQALLTFVIVGGGPTGVEMAGALAELMQVILRRDMPALVADTPRVILLEATDHILSTFREHLQREAMAELRRKAVDVRLGAAVASMQSDRVVLADGSIVPTHTVVWAAGVRAAGLARAVATEAGAGGRLRVDAYLRLPGHPEVYAIGDIAAVTQGGVVLPMLAPVAMQAGSHVADAIRRTLAGRPPAPFRYRSHGTMATIGRSAAVAQIGPLGIAGFAAWVAWLALHLIWLIGFRNRLAVLINWGWDYLFYERANRLMFGAPHSGALAQVAQFPAPDLNVARVRQEDGSPDASRSAQS